MFNWFKKSVKKISLTTDKADSGFSTRGDAVRFAIGDTDKITHERVSAVSNLYLGVGIKKCMYRLRNSTAYGIVLGVEGVKFDIDEEKGLVDVTLRLVDVGLCSSLVLEISIVEVDEFLEPVEDIVITTGKEKTQ